MDAENGVKVNVTAHGIAEGIEKSWKFLAFLIFCVWTVLSWKAGVEKHNDQIDEHLHTIDLHMQLEDQQLNWIVEKMGRPPAFVDPPSIITQGVKRKQQSTNATPRLASNGVEMSSDPSLNQ